jgi:hypothetical protein
MLLYPRSKISLVPLSRDSSVDITVSYGLDDLCSVLGGGKALSLLHNVQTGSDAHSFYQIGIGAYSSGIRRQEREADYSHLVPRSRIVELNLHLPQVFMARCLIN